MYFKSTRFENAYQVEQLGSLSFDYLAANQLPNMVNTYLKANFNFIEAYNIFRLTESIHYN